ncbi:haloacid dehalogenase [Enterococcus saigonensis]|uniref:Haloacid dehalogenase n=1 Tax=Enterococcus saigonensis TaxID=1805431 RepID=A0A679I7W0_9ENTE|nr:HAD family phosphatase [Enterococcus saigonensis]BCA85678.1 haloacid dehalogenase [Enterococcus saigonensis]
MTLGIIFDMDGVLIDSESFYFQRRMDFFNEKNLVPGSKNKLDFVGLTEAGIWQVLVPTGEDRELLRKEYLDYRKKHPIDFTQVLRSDVTTVLDYLKRKKIKIAIASSSPKSEIDAMLEQNNLVSFFDFIISGETLARSKPDPQIYQLSEAALDCDRCLAVEDSPVGISAAKAAQLYTLALKQDFPIDQSQADLVIDDLLDIIKVVENCLIF